MTAGAAWFSGAFSKVARVGQIAGSKTKEKFNLAVSNMASKVSHQTNPHFIVLLGCLKSVRFPNQGHTLTLVISEHKKQNRLSSRTSSSFELY